MDHQLDDVNRFQLKPIHIANKKIIAFTTLSNIALADQTYQAHHYDDDMRNSII